MGGFGRGAMDVGGPEGGGPGCKYVVGILIAGNELGKEQGIMTLGMN